MTWPAIAAPSIEMPTEIKDNSLQSPLVNGQSVSRKKYTRQLRDWSLKWAAMVDTQLATLLAYYATQGGGSASFQWADEFGNNYTVRFNGNISHVSVSATHSAVALKLSEV